MADFQFSKFDGSQPFTPQSTDALFDEFAEHMLQHGDEMLDYLDQWEWEHPDVIDALMKRWRL